jgi:uncharacterized protein (DUF58 family)
MIRPIRSHFFNTIWFYSAGGLLIVGMIIGQPAVSLLASTVFITAGATWIWTRQALAGLSFKRHLSETRAFRGETITATLKLENHSWLPLAWVEIDEHISDRVRPRNSPVMPSDRIGSIVVRHATPLRWKQRITWTIDLECRERGLHLVGPTSIRSGDPFGFFTRQMTIDHVTPFLVYPDVVTLENMRFPPDFPFGARRVRRHLLTDPLHIIGVRDYAPDDSIRHIHWKASARLGEPQVKVFEPTVDLHTGLFLNLDTFERYWEGMDSVRAESAIIAAASIATQLINQRAMVGLSANAVMAGSDQNLRVPAGRGSRQLETVLEGLARLTPMSVSNFPRLLSAEAREYPSGSTIVVIACIMTSSLEIAIRSLLEQGKRVVLISVGEFDVPGIRGLETVPVRGDLAWLQRDHHHRYARTVRTGALTLDR